MNFDFPDDEVNIGGNSSVFQSYGQSSSDVRKYDEDLTTLGEETLEDDSSNDEYDEEGARLNEIEPNADILSVEGFPCPREFINILTPMEFEEIVSMFKQYDINDSGKIDKHEARKILLHLGLDSSLENAVKLMAIADPKGNEEMSFEIFCRFIVMLKQGDERLLKYRSLLDKLQDTPLGVLGKQAKNWNLNIRFVTLTPKVNNSIGGQMLQVIEVCSFLCILLINVNLI